MQQHNDYFSTQNPRDTTYRPTWESDEDKVRSLWLSRYPMGVRLSISDDYNSGRTQEKAIFLTYQDLLNIHQFIEDWLPVVEHNRNPCKEE